MASKISGNTVRIIGGKWRSRKIRFPDVNGLRPTGDRIRETLFNWLQDDISGACCLDLFAGSGACGIEALSRGAHEVLFVERDSAAVSAIRANLTALGEEKAAVVSGDALAWLAARPVEYQNRVHLVFLDPPYALHLLPEALAALVGSGVLRAGARLYVESDRPPGSLSLPSALQWVKDKKAGAVYYGLLTFSPVAMEP